MTTCKHALAMLLAAATVFTAPLAGAAHESQTDGAHPAVQLIAQSGGCATRAQAAAAARSRTGGGTVLQVRTRRNNGSCSHTVRVLNPKGQVVVITVGGKR